MLPQRTELISVYFWKEDGEVEFQNWVWDQGWVSVF